MSNTKLDSPISLCFGMTHDRMSLLVNMSVCVQFTDVTATDYLTRSYFREGTNLSETVVL